MTAKELIERLLLLDDLEIPVGHMTWMGEFSGYEDWEEIEDIQTEKYEDNFRLTLGG